ncbi:SMI1/KNR4 family protein [Streptomyces sp. NPDC088925]|uniref:SMI1/KNR4 family protein n=1 Tax=Streptomyces sp. NPDC088925 TaxID=3365914 RepID=UPI00380DA155
MLTISEIASVVGKAPDSVAGLTGTEIDSLRELWGVQRLPERYEQFLSLMGRSAGRILRGTDAFFPRVLDMRRASDEFFASNVGGMDLPQGAVVFAIHQGYQVYWMEVMGSQDPPVSLYMEGEPAPMMRWSSFTEFLNAEYSDAYPGF